MGKRVPPRNTGVQETKVLGEEEFGVDGSRGPVGRASVTGAPHLSEQS